MNDGTTTSSPGPDAERAQREHQRVGAVGDAGGVARAEVGGELGLEGGDLRAEDEAAAVDDLGDLRVDLRAQRRERRLRVEQRDGHPKSLEGVRACETGESRKFSRAMSFGANMRMPHILVATIAADARHRGPGRRGARLGPRRLRPGPSRRPDRTPTAVSARANFVFFDARRTTSTSARPPTAPAPAARPSTNGCDTGSLPLGTPVDGRRREQARHARLQLVARDAGGRRDRRGHLRLQRPRA